MGYNEDELNKLLAMRIGLIHTLGLEDMTEAATFETEHPHPVSGSVVAAKLVEAGYETKIEDTINKFNERGLKVRVSPVCSGNYLALLIEGVAI